MGDSPGFSKKPGESPNFVFSKYQVPNEILACPAGSKAFEGGEVQKKGKNDGSMFLNKEGLLPEPPVFVDAHNSKRELRNIFMNCVATRGTNQAARDYRRWFCDVSHKD